MTIDQVRAFKELRPMKRLAFLLSGTLLFVLLATSCIEEDSTQTDTPPTAISVATPTSVPVDPATATPEPTHTALPTATPTPAPPTPTLEPPTHTPEPPTPTPEPPTPTPEPPTPTPEPIVKSFSDEFVQNSLVRVRAYIDDYSYYIGTGVIIRREGQEYVITNRHVVEDRDDIRIIGKAYGFARPQSIAIDLEYDVAILTPTINQQRLDVSDYGLELAARDANPPSTAWFGLFRNNAADITHVAPATYCDTTTVRGIESWVYDLTTFRGTSGSPIINSQGHLIAVHWGILSGRDTCREAGRDPAKGYVSVGESYSVPVHAIHSLFDDIAKEDAGGESDS